MCHAVHPALQRLRDPQGPDRRFDHEGAGGAAPAKGVTVMTRGWKQKLAIAAGLGLCAMPALAQGPGRGKGPGGPGFGPGPHGPGDGFRLERAARALDLSDEQRAAFEKLQDQHRKDVQPLFEEARRLQSEVREALDSGKAEPATVGERVIQAHKLMAQAKESREAFEASFEGLLTPEQLETWKTLEEARERMRASEDPRGPRGPGQRHRGPGPGGPPVEDDEPDGR
jgi:Spy/CpxP family protein refolding chaperone